MQNKQKQDEKTINKSIIVGNQVEKVGCDVSIYLDVGFLGWLLKVVRNCGNNGYEVEKIDIKTFLLMEYGGAFDQSNFETLLTRRSSLMIAEGHDIKHVSHGMETLSREAILVTSIGWQECSKKLQSQLGIYQNRIDKLEKNASEVEKLLSVARICLECEEPFPLINQHQEICLSCTNKRAQRLHERNDIDCHKCGKHILLKSIRQEPATGRFFCALCAKPCNTKHCQYFTNTKHKFCIPCNNHFQSKSQKNTNL